MSGSRGFRFGHANPNYPGAPTNAGCRRCRSQAPFRSAEAPGDATWTPRGTRPTQTALGLRHRANLDRRVRALSQEPCGDAPARTRLRRHVALPTLPRPMSSPTPSNAAETFSLDAGTRPARGVVAHRCVQHHCLGGAGQRSADPVLRQPDLAGKQLSLADHQPCSARSAWRSSSRGGGRVQT